MAPRQIVAPCGGDDQQHRRRAVRARRWRLRASLWKLSTLPSVKGCGRNVLLDEGCATLLRDTNNVAGYAGVQRCSSLWSCPCCSARIRAERATDVHAAGVEHLRRGGGLAFLTLTLPHDNTDALADTLDTVLAGWRHAQQGRAWREAKRRLGLRFVRAVEVTHTRREDGGSGWHPHVHVLLFTDAPLGRDDAADLLGLVEARWGAYVVSRGFRRPREGGIGARLQLVEGRSESGEPDGLLAYLTKVQDGYGDAWNVGTELARGDLKSGRRALSRTPFDLAQLAADGDPAALVLWHEYEQATKGRRALHWSKGLRADLLPAEETPDDQVGELDGPAEVVASFPFDLWRAVCRAGIGALLLDLAEAREDEQVRRVVDGLARTLPLPQPGSAAGADPPAASAAPSPLSSRAQAWPAAPSLRRDGGRGVA